VLAKESALERELNSHDSAGFSINLQSPGGVRAANVQRVSMLPLKLAYGSRCRAEFLTETVEGDALGVERELDQCYLCSPTPAQEGIDDKRHIRPSDRETICPHDYYERTEIFVREQHAVFELHGISGRLVTSRNAARIDSAMSANGTIFPRRDVIKRHGSSFPPDVDCDGIEERCRIDEMAKNSGRLVMTNFHFFLQNVRARRGCCYYIADTSTLFLPILLFYKSHTS
jgi:hypothetical protein